jgi:hypothetical protein
VVQSSGDLSTPPQSHGSFVVGRDDSFMMLRDLPDVPDYGEHEMQFVHARVLAPNSPWEHWEWRVNMSASELTQEGFDSIINGRQRFFIWGRIRYRDVVGNGDVHESRFCYAYSNTLQGFIPGGPGKYTGYT